MTFKHTVIIPSRYGSKRFNGKPLALVAGKPMIQRVYEQAIQSNAIKNVWIATDDDRIFNTVKDFGGKAIKTSSNLRSGTDRVAQAAEILNLNARDIIINIQGDQPVFHPECMDQLLMPFKKNPDLLMSTLAVKIVDPRELTDVSAVKVVFDKNGHALYFSRSLIPFNRDKAPHADVYKHLGFYAYKKHFLDNISGLPAGRLEKLEKLEQLRVLEHGYKIGVAVTGHDSLSVDVPEDIKAVESLLLKNDSIN